MILRRLAEHLKQQHWTGVFIELVIVVLGVFLGMQVSNWNADRVERSEETRHLQEIAEDLRADVDVFELIRKAALMRIGAVDYILGETRGVSRPSQLNMPTGEIFDIPAGVSIAPERRKSLLTLANLVRVTVGNRTGFEALVGSGGMQTLRDAKIRRQVQQYYAQMDDLISTQNMIRQIRNDGTQIGYPLGLSSFGEMDADKLTAIVRSSPSYSSYLRTSREWAAIHLSSVDQQKHRALALLADINRCLGKSGSPGQ
jgi:hypothetical protein